jgi:cell division septation protein DedD
MAIDYRERKPVGKNKPRKQPGKSLAGLLLSMAAIGYAAGVASGWLFFHAPPPPIIINQAQAPATVPPSGVQPEGGESGQPGTAPAPLSFYETLPKGSSAVMGSGLNLAPARPLQPPPQPASPEAPASQVKTAEPAPKTASQDAPTKASSAATAAPKASPVAPPAATEPKSATAAPAKPAADKGSSTYTVQAASCQSRTEAEQIRSRLAKTGMTPYIVEATVPGKGTWYRIRIGRGLSQAEAMSVAAKAGPGAEVVPERTKLP